jgi:two-component system sensor histidine kinase PhoQ
LKSGIQTRLLLITTLVLGSFLTLTGLVLDRSFRLSVLSGAEEQLRLVIYSLMGAVQSDDEGLALPDQMPEPRLGQPESGLYAWVTDSEGNTRWRSPSAVTGGVSFPEDGPRLQPGEFSFRAESADGTGLIFLSYAVIWEDPEESLLTFRVGADRAPFHAAIQSFRRNLSIGLSAVTLLFVLAQYLAVRWGLRPLRTMAQEVREMEEGHRERLSAAYPAELRGLAENLDRFVAHEQRSRSRYRNALEQVPPEPRDLLAEQLDRMQTTVTHQLSRASVTGPLIVSRQIELRNLIERLLRALDTAYRDRGIRVQLDVPASLSVRADERDLMEILGNLLENAFKYSRSKIRVSGRRDAELQIVVEDDGPGIAPEVRDAVLNRGTRADEVESGQGIGLAVVAELVELYKGRLRIGDSALGGASLRLELP